MSSTRILSFQIVCTILRKKTLHAQMKVFRFVIFKNPYDPTRGHRVSHRASSRSSESHSNIKKNKKPPDI